MKTFTLALCMLLGSTCMAQPGPSFYIDTICHNPPGLVDVPVKVTDFTDVASVAFNLYFDNFNNNLQYTFNYAVNPAVTDGVVTINPLPGEIMFTWFSILPATIANDEAIVTFTFQHNQDSCYLNFSVPPAPGFTNGMILPSTVTLTQQPQNFMTAEGQTAIYTVTSATQGTLIQWMCSTDGGMTWFNLVEAPPYTGVQQPVLMIDSVPLSFNQYLYKAHILNCGGFYSDAALLTVMPNSSCTGTLTYLNSQNSPMSNVTINLDQNGITQYSATTDINGVYTFPFVLPGAYDVHYQLTQAFGGVNAVDALMILQYSVGMIQLNGLFLQVADVNASGFINSVDALLALKRFVGMITSFPAGDWQFDVNTLNMPVNTALNLPMHCLCTGDTDGSHIP